MFSVKFEFVNKKGRKGFLPLIFFLFQGNARLKAECITISAYFSTFLLVGCFFNALREGECVCVCRFGVYVLLFIWCMDCYCLIKEGDHMCM